MFPVDEPQNIQVVHVNSHPCQNWTDGERYCKCCVGIVCGGGICFASGTQTIEGIEHAWNAEANEAQNNGLGQWVRILIPPP